MVKIELDIKGISWYIETTLGTDTVPVAGDIIIVDKDCISARDRAELWKIPSNQVFKWVGEEEGMSVMEWFDNDTEMLVSKRTWKYDIEEEETMCILSVEFIRCEDLQLRYSFNDTQSVNIGQTARWEASTDYFRDRETSGFLVTFFTHWQAHGRK